MELRSSANDVMFQRVFSPVARKMLSTLADHFSLTSDYMSDYAGNDMLGLVSTSGDRRDVLIVYPTAYGIIAEDEAAEPLGCFEHVEELRAALTTQLIALAGRSLASEFDYK